MSDKSDSISGSSQELRLPPRYRLVAILGIALIALSLNGSVRIAANGNSGLSSELLRMRAHATQLASAGRYLEARDEFYKIAGIAARAGDQRRAALSWSSAGACSLNRLEFHHALEDFLRAREIAEAAHDSRALGSTLNNLASLYNQMGDSLAALHISREALGMAEESTGLPHEVTSRIDAGVAARIRYQMAHALAGLGRMGEAEPLYLASIAQLEKSGDVDTSTRIRGNFGADLIAAGRDSEAEAVLTPAMSLRNEHHLPVLGNVVRGLALIHGHRAKPDAETLFQAAIDAPPGLAPRWDLFADRGEYRLNKGDTASALADFREARRLALALRADVVPADQDRIAFESSLGQILAGMVDAGNRLARKSRSQTLIRETFDIAEQDRLWSLRALVPTADDWRSHLPPRYWDVLARYRAGNENLRAELDELEAEAAAASHEPSRFDTASPVEHMRKALAANDDSVLFSFHLSPRDGWVWAVDAGHTSVYSIPARGALAAKISGLVAALRRRDPSAEQLGAQLYRELFGVAAPGYLGHRRWLLELDGPLNDLPFGALVPRKDLYLAETKVIEAIPSSLLFGQSDAAPAAGGFLGIGDPIYNAADSRYHGDRSAIASANRGAIRNEMLPRLPGTAAELDRCSREWGAPNSTILTGADASPYKLTAALRKQPDILHFATHVVPSIEEGAGGLIALSIDGKGRPGLVGPAEIVSRPVKAHLVILDGCHSGAGAALPASGLLGLTRSWLGAGAHSVLATRWDVSDDDAPDFMVEFYRRLRRTGSAHAAEAFADTEMALLKTPSFRAKTDFWAAYFVLGRQ